MLFEHNFTDCHNLMQETLNQRLEATQTAEKAFEKETVSMIH